MRAYAKINLTLDITGKRFDGYHTIESIMQPIDLYDVIDVKLRDFNDINTVICDDPSVPCDIRNTAYKAAKLMLKQLRSDKTFYIDIKKNIPSQAGLGGASADAAVVMRIINAMFNVALSDEHLNKIAAEVGADVPFCLFGSTALCQGIGDVITPLPMLKKHHVVIVKPEFGISTPEAYRLYDEKGLTPRHSTKKVVRAMLNYEDIYPHMSNDFEELINNDAIYAIKMKLLNCKALCAQMSGSGSAVFGLFKDEQDAKAAYDRLSKEYKCYLTTTR